MKTRYYTWLLLVITCCNPIYLSYGLDGNPCWPKNPCYNGGTCKIVDENDWECECPPGYSGTQCEKSVCAPNPCLNGGLCQITEDGSYKCICSEGWEGQNCTKVIDYSGCSSFAESKCSFKDDIIIETVVEVSSIDMCQFYCSIIYSEACEYFVFDRKLETCDVMKTSEMETCVKNSGGIKPNATSCGTVFTDGIYEHDCLNFREGLCTYEGDRLEALGNIPSMEVCQMACQHYSLDPATTCKFFVYDSETKNCELLNSGERDCDIVRGTPQPDFEQCKKDGFINWPDRC